MSRTRSVLGIAAGIILVLDSAAHSLLGWPELRAALGRAGASPDLTTGLGIGWQFGGAAMLVFGILALATFFDGWRGRAVALRTPLLTGLLFVLFGIGAFFAGGRSPFFLVTFVLPGALLLAAAWGRGEVAARP